MGWYIQNLEKTLNQKLYTKQNRPSEMKEG